MGAGGQVMEYENTGINEYAFGNPTDDEVNTLLNQGFIFWCMQYDDEGNSWQMWVK